MVQANQGASAQLDPTQARIKLQREFSGENDTGIKEESLRLKDLGNDLFRQKQYAQAINAYSQAITINQTNPSYFLNRAKCYKELNQFQQMLQDATMAVELDDTYVKAFQSMGEALVELGKLDVGSCAQIEKGITRMRKAYSLCTG